MATVCTRCVMDTSDPEISFDAAGVCNHCREFDEVTAKDWYPNEEGKRRWDALLRQIRLAGKGRQYDCILGLSGGVDSSYLALKAHEWGLRPLVMHVDAGWNSELAVQNIEAVVKHCNFDLHTHVVDWNEMRDLQLAFLRSGIANQDVPQDHVFAASVYHFAIENRIKIVLNGGNTATESIFPRAWHGSAMDATCLKAIHKRYGKRPLRSIKTISFFDYYIGYPLLRGMKVLRPLNFMNYRKADAIAELQSKVGWRPYDRKHGESLFTRFFQNYWLPSRFGYDKRRPHLSSLIVSGQISRQEALAELEKPLYEAGELERDLSFFCKKLGIDREELGGLLNAPLRSHTDFPNWDSRYLMLKRVQAIVAATTGRKVKIYS